MPTTQSYLRYFVFGLLVLVAPPLILAGLLALRLSPMSSGVTVTFIEIGVALIPGAVGIALFAPRLGPRLLALLFYVPTMGFALSLWGLLFMCSIFGACL